MDIGEDKLKNVVFANTNDQIYDPPKIIFVDPMKNWYIWKLNEPFIEIGILPKEYHKIVEPGGIVPYVNIVTRLKYGYYQSDRDYYNIIKRIPLPYADSYVKEEADDKTVYYHFLGQNVIRELIVENGKRIRLTSEKPDAGGHTMRKEIFSDTVWHFKNFISEEEFGNAWEGKTNNAAATTTLH